MVFEIFLGLDSQFAIIETVLTGVLDFAPKLRPKKTAIVGGVCFVGFICGLPLTTPVWCLFWLIFKRIQCPKKYRVKWKKMLKLKFNYIYIILGWRVFVGPFGLLCSRMALPLYWIVWVYHHWLRIRSTKLFWWLISHDEVKSWNVG